MRTNGESNSQLSWGMHFDLRASSAAQGDGGNFKNRKPLGGNL